MKVVIDPSLAQVQIVCPYCETRYRFSLPADGYAAWQNGTDIALSLPNLSRPLTQLLTQHICPSCWATLDDTPIAPVDGDLVPCPDCNGDGFNVTLGRKIEEDDRTACPTCAATGEVLQRRVCHECNGEGSIIRASSMPWVCALCNGEGLLW